MTSNISRAVNSPYHINDHSIWRATKRLKQPAQTQLPLWLPNGNWAGSVADKEAVFAAYLQGVFQSNSSGIDPLLSILPLARPVSGFCIGMNDVLNCLLEKVNSKDSSGFEKNTGKWSKS